VPYLKRLVAGFPLRRPGFDPRSGHVGFVVDKAALGQFFSKYFGFPFQFSIHPLLHISSSSIIRGWYNRPVSVRRTKCTQSHPTQRKGKKQLGTEKTLCLLLFSFPFSSISYLLHSQVVPHFTSYFLDLSSKSHLEHQLSCLDYLYACTQLAVGVQHTRLGPFSPSV
jgi:hypothetical protein